MMLTADTATTSHLAGRFFGSPASCPAAAFTSLCDDAMSHEHNCQVKCNAERKGEQVRPRRKLGNNGRDGDKDGDGA